MDLKQIGKKAILPITSAILGGAVVAAAYNFGPSIHSKFDGERREGRQNEQIYDDILHKQDSIRRQFDTLFDDGYVAQNDPFAEMKKMRNQMEKRMGSFAGKRQSRSNPFDAWFSDKFGGGTINDILKREDDNFIYYDVKVDDVNSTSINTKVEQGYVTISGTTEKGSGFDGQDENASAQSLFRSSFNRTFPLPENVDQYKMQMVTNKDVITLKFPKLKS